MCDYRRDLHWRINIWATYTHGPELPPLISTSKSTTTGKNMGPFQATLIPSSVKSFLVLRWSN
jgi:hypothetical protein